MVEAIESDILPENLCEELNQYEQRGFCKQNEITIISNLEKAIVNACKDKKMFEKLIEFTKQVIFKKRQTEAKDCFFVPKTGITIKIGDEVITSKKITRDSLMKLKEFPPDLENYKSGFVFISETEKQVTFLYQYINYSIDYDWNRLKKIKTPHTRDIVIKYTNPMIFFEETQSGYIAHLRKEIRERLETYLHPVGVYFCDNSTEILKDFIGNVLSNKDLMENSSEREITIKKAKLKFREEGSEITLKNIEAKGNNMLKHPGIKDLVKKGGRLIKIECKPVYFRDKTFEVIVGSYEDFSYISVDGRKDTEKQDSDDLLDILKREYFNILPACARG